MSRLRFALAAVAAAAGLALAAPASADTINPASNGNLCLDMQSGEGRLARCNGNYTQDFVVPDGGYLRVGKSCVATQGEGYALTVGKCRNRSEFYWSMGRNGTLENDAGLCADVEKGKIRDGQRVIGWQCTGTQNQRWETGYYDDGGHDGGNNGGGWQTSSLVPQHAQGLCLDYWHDGGAMIVHTCQGSDNQLFSYSYGRNTEIQVQGQCLTAPSPGQQVYVRRCNGSSAQSWSFQRDGSIQSSSGYCMDVQGSKRAAGTFVLLFECTGNRNQLWSGR